MTPAITPPVPLNELPAFELACMIRARTVGVEEVARACLSRIEEREGIVQAWAALDPDAVLREARRLDSMAPTGPLHGVPVGVKDVIDATGLPTAMGSPIYKDYRPWADSACVGALKAAGALILGKTVTAEFAGSTAGPTTNPRDASRSPGGSSSGSAAAVADFMAPIALGTQTGGSIIRPASFCGVVGYKPSFGLVSRAGLKFAAESLDTIGVISRSVQDLPLTMGALAQIQLSLAPNMPAPRIGLCRTPFWGQADPSVVEAVERAAANLSATGADVVEIDLPDYFDALPRTRDIINSFERARAMAHEWRCAPELISPQMRQSISSGLSTPVDRYRSALRFAERCRETIAATFETLDVLLTPAASAEAPVGLDWTGDVTFQGLWTLLHLPCITLPGAVGAAGMPVGIQFVAARHGDASLISTAQWVENSSAAPRGDRPKSPLAIDRSGHEVRQHL